jgi:hypothetical protein
VKGQLKNQQRYRFGRVDLYACAQGTEQQELEGLALIMGVRTSDCETDMP